MKPKRSESFSSEFKLEAIMQASEEGMTDKALCYEQMVGSSHVAYRLPGKTARLFPAACVAFERRFEGSMTCAP